MLLFASAACLIDEEAVEKRRAELTDGDGDGFAAEDECDDEDASAFPGAEERCDGVDDDCDGDIDEDAVDAVLWYADEDVDGFGAGPPVGSCDAPAGHVANQLDCDDAATKTNPEEDEVPYDGIDQDCSGADLTDVDGDGGDAVSVGGADCDDDDPAVNAAATEVPYDGVDQDCTAGDLVDQDGDGEAGDEVGGPDCDDVDATIAASAEETWANGFTDNNCDGDPGTAVATLDASLLTTTHAGANLGRQLYAAGDLEGDGTERLLVAAPYDATLATYGGAVWIFPADQSSGDIGEPSVMASDEYSFLGTGLGLGPDLNGNGTRDVLVGATGYWDGRGGVFAFDGGSLSASGLTPTDAIGTFVGDTEEGYAGASCDGVGDLDGDGVEEIAIGAPYASDPYPYAGAVYVYAADAFAADVLLPEDADGTWLGYFENQTLGQDVTAVGDQDGDGLVDMGIASTNGVTWTVTNGAGGSAEDALVRITDAHAEFAVTSIPDVDMDGLSDVVLLGEDARVFSDLASASVWGIEEYRFALSGDGSSFSSAVGLGDLDEDGAPELLVTVARAEDASSWAGIVEGAAVYTGGVASRETLTLTAIATEIDQWFGYASAIASDSTGAWVYVSGWGADTIATDAGAVARLPVPE
jgi:Putative metal-binding motif/FG-GAP repeat